jgi:hypothetical protein
MPIENEGVEISAKLSFATDKQEMNVFIESKEEMSPTEWANILREVADQIELQGDEIYNQSEDELNFHN